MTKIAERAAWRVWSIWALAALLVGLACVRAWYRWLWFDELLTLHISALPAFSEVYAALRSGADFNPPFFYLLVRASCSVFGQSAFAIRLPSVLGLLLCCVCIYRFVRKRLPAEFAALAALTPLLTAARDYSVEARPYGVLMGFSAAALLCWQACGEAKARLVWLCALAVSVGCTVASHYYGMLPVLCLGCAEAYRWFSNRWFSNRRGSFRIQWPVCVAFAAGLLPLLFYRDLIFENKRLSTTYFGLVWWGQLPDFYKTLLLPTTMAVLLMAIATLAIRNQGSPQPGRLSIPPAEMLAAGLLAGLGLVAILFAYAFTGVFLFRYALESAIGVGILASYLASRFVGSHLAGVLVLIIACFLSVDSALETRRSFRSRQTGSNPEAFQLRRPELIPIVIEDLRVFLPDAFYGKPEFTSHAYYLTDEDFGLRYEGSNTNDHIMKAFGRIVHLNIIPFASFLNANQRFYVYYNARPSLGQPVSSEGAHVGWQLRRFIDSGYHVEIVDETGTAMLLLVSHP